MTVAECDFEDNNITALFGKKLPDVPEGYNYDFVNADALVNVLAVKNKTIKINLTFLKKSLKKHFYIRLPNILLNTNTMYFTESQ